MTEATMITRPEANRRKAALETKLRELLGSSLRREDMQIEHEADPLDQIKGNLDREMAIEQLDQRARLAQEVRLALTAIAEHTYGVCEHCEEPIPSKRLDALPWARLCVACKSEEESAHRQEHGFFQDAA